MKADLSRDSFSAEKRYSRVILQEGRILTDADWNEQTSILLHHLRALTADLIGPHGGAGDSFRIDPGRGATCDFGIGAGRYYVNGILCENFADEAGVAGSTYTDQPDFPIRPGSKAWLEPGAEYLVYMDVWERHVSALEDPDLLEPALGGQDTTTRVKVVWQVKAVPLGKKGSWESDEAAFEALVVEPSHRPRSLRARAAPKRPRHDDLPGPAGYLGSENRLYRVEIHDPGGAGRGATFKWSRDNGSIAFGIEHLENGAATLLRNASQNMSGLNFGAVVEIVDNHSVLHGEPGTICEIKTVDVNAGKVAFDCPDRKPLRRLYRSDRLRPILRQWDQAGAPQAVRENTWIELEDGIEIQFTSGGTYRTGDYWLIPARSAIGDILWPARQGADALPKALPPRGITHNYAPLARISLDDDGTVRRDADLRRAIQTAAQFV